ncbi:MAG: V-type ATP synthase subunit D [Chitinivibrionales bacterium]|nr:V-type ATP synthase subunit D [Chitinivibrionales bacterium]
MTQLNCAPTKTNLMKLRNDLSFAQEGHELLDQKRNILIIELMNFVDQAVDYQHRIEEALAAAYRELHDAVLHRGRLKVLNLSSSVNIKAEATIRTRKVMGVPLPIVDTEFEEKGPFFSPEGTSYHIESALQEFKNALKMLGKLAELKVSVLRLANEVRKTIRKVNALEKIAIPDLKETVHAIQNRLEENERDMFSLMKTVKERLEQKRKHERETAHHGTDS